MAKTFDTRRHRAALPVFTPSAVAPEALAARTVGREAEIERLVSAIRTAATTDNRPHQLIVGPRGSGKSHLLIVAIHEALSDEQIAARVAVAMLPEDAVEIAGYEDLLVSIIDRAPGGDDERRETARDLRARHDTAGLEQAMLGQLGDRVLVLVVENLDRVFADLGEHGQARLRNLTETSAQVLLLASAPLLFGGVSEHARPWYGSFQVEHLNELDAVQGRDLLRGIAAASGDEELATSLDTPTGLSRVRAVEHLAGGSPRMWTVLAGCMTVDLLDELVPLVEALFDALAPYYQQRLWELAGVERKLVYELCRVQSATVKDLAHETGLTQRAAATSLGRLRDASWVRRDKRPGTDRRTTWYSLREPLLGHHVQYRETRDRQLPAIVGFLRSWYETEDLARHLARIDPASLGEGYLLAALSQNPSAQWLGAWPVLADADDLVTSARHWLSVVEPSGVASIATGVVGEAVGIASRDGVAAAADIAARRLEQFTTRGDGVAEAVDAALHAMQRPGDAEDLRECGLRAAITAPGNMPVRDRIALGLLVSFLNGVPTELDWLEGATVVHHDHDGDEADRLILLLEATIALAAFSDNPEEGVVSAGEALLACAEQLGADDHTTIVFALQTAATSATASRAVGLERLAAIIVDVFCESGRTEQLTTLLLTMWVLRESLGVIDDDFRAWLAGWANATENAQVVKPFHRFLKAVSTGDPSAVERLAGDDLEHLWPLLATAVDQLRAVAEANAA